MSRMDDWNYHRDPRTWDVGSAYEVLESGPNSSKVRLDECLLEDLQDEGLLPADHDGVLEVRTRFEVCDQCQGSGTMVNPSIDAGGLTRDDLYDDPDFAADYFGGRFDVQCSRCKGKRVESVMVFPEELEKAVRAWEDSLWADAAEAAAERAMGA